MDLEFQQIDLRYEGLRKRDPQKEHLLLASLEARGQICPVVVLAQKAATPYVLLDGHKRLRALKRLRQDTVRATIWDLDEAEALLLERLMRTGRAESPLEQGWLLGELKDRFGMPLEVLARADRFITAGKPSRRKTQKQAQDKLFLHPAGIQAESPLSFIPGLQFRILDLMSNTSLFCNCTVI